MPPTSLAAEELQALRNKAKAQIERLWTAVWQHPPGVCLSNDDLEKIGIKWLPFTWTSSGDSNDDNDNTDNINGLNPDFEPCFFQPWSLEKLRSHPVDMDRLGEDAPDYLTYPDYSAPAVQASLRDGLIANVVKADGIYSFIHDRLYHVPRVGYGRFEDCVWYPVW